MSDYPERLIPKPNYRIIDNDVIMSQNGLWLIRHVESDAVRYLGNTNTLSPDSIKIQSDHLRDLSNNLLGIFQIEDIFFGINKSHADYYCDCWDGTSECKIPSDDHFFRDKNREHYFIPVDDLLKERITIENVMNDTAETYHFKILHTPTRCNYWHISIRVYNDENQEVSNIDVSKKKKSRIWKAVRDYLITFVKYEVEDEYTVLAPNLYRTEIQST